MKSKILIFCATLCCLFIFTACEPNVDNGNTDTSIDTTPIVENNDTVTGSTEPQLTGEITDETEDTNTQAAGDETSAALSVFKNNLFNDNGLNAVAVSAHPSNKKIGWGLGKTADDRNRPLDAISAGEKYKDFNALFIGGDENKIYLTFDEGYENGYTPKILDVLKEKGAKATFFVTYDYCKSSPELVKRMIDEGHTVGNHSYTHSSFPDCSDGEVEDEIIKLHDYVSEVFGYEMNLVRPPKGEFSERSLSITKSLGYISVFWSFAYADWDVNNQPSVSEVYEKVTKSTHPGEIVLLHAVSKANADSLADILDFWKVCGYETGLFENQNAV